MAPHMPNPVDIHVGGRVRLRRMLMGMSQEELGKQLGLTFQQVQKYEKGSNRISASRLHAIAAILDVPIPFFFEGYDDKESARADVETDALMSFVSSADGIRLNLAFSAIADNDARRAIVKLVEAIARPAT